MNRLQWLLDRQRGVGSSDAPNLVGAGYRDAAAVYRSKVLPPIGDEPTTGVLARGVALEGIVAAIYEREMGVTLAPTLPNVVHRNRPWQMANPDRVRDDGRYVEIKTVTGFGEDWGPGLTDAVPDGYAVQVQHQMGVLGAESIDLAALDVIGWELRVYRIAFDPGFFDWLTGVEERFWREHVEKRLPPGPEWEQAFSATALDKFVREKRIELGRDAVALIERRKEIGAVRDEADEEYRRLTSRLTAMMGDAERATAGAWNVKRIQVEGGTYTATRQPYSRLDVRPGKKVGK